jgi:hypothetical protein
MVNAGPRPSASPLARSDLQHLDDLELGVRGAIPTPEFAAQLLRRFKTAIVESARSFTPPESDNNLYQNAPPPRA